jgi:hypothetical protein
MPTAFPWGNKVSQSLPDAEYYLGSVYPTENPRTIRESRQQEIKLAKQFQVFTLMRAAGHFDQHAIYTEGEVRSLLLKLAIGVDSHMANCFPNNTLR